MNTARRIGFALMLVSLIAPAWGANWLTIANDRFRRVELDKTSILSSDAGTKVAWGRIVLSDGEAANVGYKTLRALNRYNCRNRTFVIVKRIFLSADNRTLREESVDENKVMRIKPDTVDERFWVAVCQPANAIDLRNIAEAAGDKAAAQPADDKRGEKSGGESDDADKEKEAAKLAEKLNKAMRQARTKTGAKGARKEEPKSEPAMPHAPLHWSYEGETGPQNWSKLSPEYALCDKGTRQSPINIRDGIKVDLEPIVFDYKPSFFRIVDNGHTIQVNYGAGSTISVMGRSYELVQLHFHRPAEERIDGRGFEMVVHLVHKDFDGHLAVVAVLLERGAPNALVQTLWNNLPLEKGQEYAPRASINIGDILPPMREYITYMGSLTTPPCTEGVLWLVMKQPMTLSAEQLAIFTRFYPMNARPVQPDSGRIIKESR